MKYQQNSFLEQALISGIIFYEKMEINILSYIFLFYKHTNYYITDIDISCEYEVYFCDKSRYFCNEKEANLIIKFNEERISEVQKYSREIYQNSNCHIYIKSSSTRVL